MINSGIGWHEARIPTIAAMVPRAAFTWATARLRAAVSLPLITSNRINAPETAEAVLARGDADMVSMARPLLADPAFVAKAAQGRADEINTCIACNQACLDQIFLGKTASCLVNPRAGHETELNYRPADIPKRIAVVGGGPAGLSCAVTLAVRGHRVTLFEQATRIGGQFNLAVRIPGKEEFRETLRYFNCQLVQQKVRVHLATRATATDLLKAGFDEIVVATGVVPRRPEIAGIDHPMVLSYVDLLSGQKPAGNRVAIVGAGGIGFDVATFLAHSTAAGALQGEDFLAQWGIDRSLRESGGLLRKQPAPIETARRIFLLQRKGSKMGKDLGKTTGWIHRASLKMRGVVMLNGVRYEAIDDRGLHIVRGDRRELLEVDNVVICAGQESLDVLSKTILAAGAVVHVIGGAQRAVELDAQRAFDQGCRLAARL
jgi:2,4-dienoyl-CoA reductase (NADPH2)